MERKKQPDFNNTHKLKNQLMKKLFTLLTAAVLLFSCTKQTIEQQEPKPSEEVLKTRNEYAASYRVPAGDDSIASATARGRDKNIFYHTCANGYEDQTYGSQGVAASANVTKLGLQGAKIKSWWIGAYYYDTLADGRRGKFWVQWGYAVDEGGLFQALYVYSISPVYGQKWPLTIINQDNSVPLQYGTRVKFEIIRVPETTYWSFLRDGRKVLDIDLGVTSFDGKLQSCTESWGTQSFSNIVHIDYLKTYKNDAWSPLPSGNIGSLNWRLEGSVQRPEYARSEHEFGGKYQTPLSYLLWQ